jgi:hypothetical protein
MLCPFQSLRHPGKEIRGLADQEASCRDVAFVQWAAADNFDGPGLAMMRFPLDRLEEDWLS